MRQDPDVTTHSADGAALVYYRWSNDGCTALFSLLFSFPFHAAASSSIHLFLFSSCVLTALLSENKKSVFLVSRVQPR